MSQPAVVVVGGGFGGLNAALTLGGAPAKITLIDRHNYHLFQPLLYQVASAALSPGDIAYPIRSIVRKQKNTDVIMAKVERIEVAEQKVILADREIPFDYLILAAGARHSYFGHDDWEAAAPGLKTIEDALAIRQKMLRAFERAELEEDVQKKAALLTFVVVGGGPTGVEMAGAISEIALNVMCRDFRHIDPRKTNILLIEAGPRILPAYPEELSEKAEKSLRKLGVTVRKGVAVSKISEGMVHLGNEDIRAENIIWAAGVSASPLAASLDAKLDKAGRAIVTPTLAIPGHDNIFVAGDLACFTGADGKPLPGLAPVAIQQGRHAARNVLRAIEKKELLPFKYNDRGSLATIGRWFAVGKIGQFPVSGIVAWLAWTFIHILFLIGFRNRFVVLFEWAWAFLSNQRAVRLITAD